MILTIRTDSPDAELSLYNNGEKVDFYTWEAGRNLARDLLKEVKDFLQRNNADFTTLTAIIVFAGPGSFTGLRIGLTIANTIAYAQNIPIVACQDPDWISEGLKRLKAGDNDQIALPHYGAEANITTPKK